MLLRLGLLCALVACGLLANFSSDVRAGDKDSSKAGTVRLAKTEEEPDVVEISEEKFACNEDVISISGIKAGRLGEIQRERSCGRQERYGFTSSPDPWQDDPLVVRRGCRGLAGGYRGTIHHRYPWPSRRGHRHILQEEVRVRSGILADKQITVPCSPRQRAPRFSVGFFVAERVA